HAKTTLRTIVVLKRSQAGGIHPIQPGQEGDCSQLRLKRTPRLRRGSARSGGSAAGFRGAGSVTSGAGGRGGTGTGLRPAFGTSGGVAIWAPARSSAAGRPGQQLSAKTRTRR